ncbi:MAG: alpha/beta hydrolase [Candidatus Nanohaloarchaea archaeon]|nr:alpha/beta hydrolase [Candidatus Nanohaloarchaea archaeon]
MDLASRTVAGSGTPIVYIHGWIGSRKSWEQVDQAADLDNPRLFYDQRCHGDSPCQPFDFQDLADDLDQLLDEKGIDRPVLAGHSMGGMVALLYALENPVSGLFLAGTAASTPEPRHRSPQYFLDRLGDMDRDEWADAIVDNYAPGDSDYGRMARNELAQAGETVLRSGLEGMIAYDVRERLGELSCHALVVGGRDDGAITPGKTEELAALLDCRREMLNCSHLMLQERPGELAGLLASFVQELQHE